MDANTNVSFSTHRAGFQSFRSDFLQGILQKNLEKAGFDTLRASMPFNPDVLPGPPVLVVNGRPISFEVAVRRPRLVTMLAGAPPVGAAVVESGSESDPEFHANIEWDVHLNLVIEPFDVVVATPQPPQPQPQPSSPFAVSAGFEALSPGRVVASPPQRRETTLLARGTALTSARLRLVDNASQYETWVQLEFHGEVLELKDVQGSFQVLLDRGLSALVDNAFDPLLGGSKWWAPHHVAELHGQDTARPYGNK